MRERLLNNMLTLKSLSKELKQRMLQLFLFLAKWVITLMLFAITFAEFLFHYEISGLHL